MELTIVGWRTKRLLLDAFEKLDPPSGLRWFPGNEVDAEEDLTLTLELLEPDPMLVFARAERGDLEALGAWLAGRTSDLHRIETAVVSGNWKELSHSLGATVGWPKWPIGWIPFDEEASQVYVRLENLVRRASEAGRARRAAAPAGRW